MDLIASEPEASIAAMAKHQQITPDEFRQSMEGIKLMTKQDQEQLLAPGGSVERSQTLIREIFAHDQPVDVH
jgi:hypothetical protein